MGPSYDYICPQNSPKLMMFTSMDIGSYFKDWQHVEQKGLEASNGV
jgi:hypothetical protein